MKNTQNSASDFTHVIDWDKVRKVEDVIELLKGLDMSFDPAKANPRLHKFLTPIDV